MMLHSLRFTLSVVFATLIVTQTARADVTSDVFGHTSSATGGTVYDTAAGAAAAAAASAPNLNGLQYRGDSNVTRTTVTSEYGVIPRTKAPVATDFAYRDISYLPSQTFASAQQAVDNAAAYAIPNACSGPTATPDGPLLVHSGSPQPFGSLPGPEQAWVTSVRQDFKVSYSVADGQGECTNDYEANFIILGERTVSCPGAGYGKDNTTLLCVNNNKAFVTSPNRQQEYCENELDTTVGNPCNAATGNKFETEVDINDPVLPFVRYYRSVADVPEARTTVDAHGIDSTVQEGTMIAPGLGLNWYHNYAAQIVFNASAAPQSLLRPNGSLEYLFYDSATQTYGSRAGSGLTLKYDAASQYWIVYHNDNRQELYTYHEHTDTTVSPSRTVRAGVLAGLRDEYGRQTSINTSGIYVPGMAQYAFWPTQVTGPDGHTLTFNYNNVFQLQSVVSSGGQSVSFDLSPTNLQIGTVTYENSATRQYTYTAGLASITNERGVQYATFTYDTNGRVTSSEHAGGVERFELDYLTNGDTEVTDPRGNVKVFDFDKDTKGQRRPLRLTNNGQQRANTFTNRWSEQKTSYTDENGARTNMTNTKWHLYYLDEAVGTPDYRRSFFQTYRTHLTDQPVTVTSPSVRPGFNKTESKTYDSYGRVLTETTSGYRPDGTAVSRTTTYTYDTEGRLATIDGPRTALSDVTTFAYHNCSTGGECGQLHTITNALGHVTTFNTYDAAGRVTQMTDPNGLITDLTYDTRGRLLTSSQSASGVTARTTTYTYDLGGRLLTTTTPDGTILTNTYNDADYLLSVTDNFGNKIEYQYDLAGNRTSETIKDTGGAIKRTVDTTYDIRDRVDTINNGGFSTDVDSDAVGNLTASVTPKSETTSNTYDKLNRLKTSVDPLLGTTTYNYDKQDNLTSVVAPNGATTTYTYDDLGNLLSETSPDRGLTSYTHDNAGNVLTRTDARNKTGTYTYDALNRKLTESYSDGESITLTYDAGSTGKGKLTSATDASGSSTYTYNVFGQLTQVANTISGTTLTTSYAYDTAGRPATMTYPSGAVLTYTWDKYLLTDLSLAGTTIFSGAAYDPFGPATGWTWGNGLTMSRTFDTRGLISSHSLASDTRTVGYDANGQIITIDDARHDLNFDYDANGRLTDYDDGVATTAPLPATQLFTYDGNGNRLSLVEDGVASNYSYVPNSNRSLAITGAGAKTFTLDAAGNRTSDGTKTYTYTDRGRLKTVSTSTYDYVYDWIGQRVEKAGTNSTLYVFGADGALLGEYDDTGAAIREYVYNGMIPVAFTNGANTYFIHTDTLGTPRLATNSSSTVVWRWESDGFGTTTADEDPDADGTLLALPVRFAGQYDDSDYGVYYNYFRTYDPSTGRYLESDPIGLWGGTNTYEYVYSNPLIYIDPYGLWALGDPLPQGFVDFSAGLGDALLLGQGQRLRDLTGVDGGVDKCSDAYDYGSYAALAAGGGRLAYAGLAKGGSLLASSGAQASAFRQSLKTFFRGGFGRNWRPPNLTGKTDAQLRASAGKTNFGINAYGAGVAAAAAAGAAECGCEQ